MKRSFLHKLTAILIVIAIGVLMFLTSCRNDGSGGTYSISFTVDGTHVEFTDQHLLTATFNQSGTQHTGSIVGTKGIGTSSVAINLFDSTAIDANTYVNQELVGTSLVGAIITYIDLNGLSLSQTIVSGGASITVEITEITDKTVRGNFFGTLASTTSQVAEVPLTDGQFLVPIGE
ncbi:MAG: hypothetical protein AAF587_10790 [Bacteroidota bacterium]